MPITLIDPATHILDIHRDLSVAARARPSTGSGPGLLRPRIEVEGRQARDSRPLLQLRLEQFVV